MIMFFVLEGPISLFIHDLTLEQLMGFVRGFKRDINDCYSHV